MILLQVLFSWSVLIKFLLLQPGDFKMAYFLEAEKCRCSPNGSITRNQMKKNPKDSNVLKYHDFLTQFLIFFIFFFGLVELVVLKYLYACW